MVRKQSSWVGRRLKGVIRDWRLILRLSIAPALAWWLAVQLFGHDQAFFAPIAAILTLTVGAGERVPVVLEIIIGASLGILVGEALINFIGQGVWQLALVVTLAVIVARFMRLPGLALTQAVITVALLVVIAPSSELTEPAFSRFVDALIGGLVALATIVLIPTNPLRSVELAIKALLNELAEILLNTSRALRDSDAELAAQTLERARATNPMVLKVISLASRATEISRLSPFGWNQRDALVQRSNHLVDLDHAVRNTRVLTRRVAAMLRKGESAPAGIADALERLGELAKSEPNNAEQLIAVARLAIQSAQSDLTINSAAIASQIRAIVADMLLAIGTSGEDLDAMLDFD